MGDGEEEDEGEIMQRHSLPVHCWHRLGLRNGRGVANSGWLSKGIYFVLVDFFH